MLEAVIFDMDGVLVETESIHIMSWRLFAERHGIEFSEEYLRGLVGIAVADNVVEIKRDFGLPEPNDQLVREKNSIYLDYVRRLRPPPMDGFAEVVAEARRLGAKAAVATSSPRVQLDAVVDGALKAMGSPLAKEEFFDALVTGEDAPRAKPAPDIYIETIRRLGVDPARSIAFEDSPAGVRAAVAAGLVTVAAPTKFTAHMEFPGAAAVIGSLREALDAGFYGLGDESARCEGGGTDD